jgi:Xaa-Pro aminopeptidase
MGEARPARQRQLARAIEEAGVPAFIVTHLPNIRWVTGFSGSAGLLVVTPERSTLITDFRYETQAAQEVGDAADVLIERRDPWERLRQFLEPRHFDALGIESEVLTVRQMERLQTWFRGRIEPLRATVETLRQVKDEDEVSRIREAAVVAQDALAEVLPTVHAGEREIDVAARLEAALRRRGSEWHPFATIVASGPRSALPHARTSTREINRGEFLLLDFGATLGGYCSDLTRTVAIGRPDGKQRAIYEVVREAQLRARTELRAGMTGKEGDALARDLIAARGYGDAFGHSLGHGLGLEVHEAPRLAPVAETALPAGAVVTVEPGVYLPGWGGVRLEDDVWLGPDGPVLLSDGRTDLTIIDT